MTENQVWNSVSICAERKKMKQTHQTLGSRSIRIKTARTTRVGFMALCRRRAHKGSGNALEMNF